MSSKVLKCHKCRQILLEDTCVIDSVITCDPKICDSYEPKNFIYIKEELAPAWIKEKVEQEQWTKGKLYCEKCKSRIGSFDYISGRKCACRTSVLPPIHLVSSHIDRPVTLGSM